MERNISRIRDVILTWKRKKKLLTKFIHLPPCESENHQISFPSLTQVCTYTHQNQTRQFYVIVIPFIIIMIFKIKWKKQMKIVSVIDENDSKIESHHYHHHMNSYYKIFPQKCHQHTLHKYSNSNYNGKFVYLLVMLCYDFFLIKIEGSIIKVIINGKLKDFFCIQFFVFIKHFIYTSSKYWIVMEI